MPTVTQQVPPVLDSAWRSYAQLDAAASRRSRAYRRLHLWIIILGVLTTLLAVLTATFFSGTNSLAGFVLKAFLVGIPVITALLAALGMWAFKNGDWLITRSAAEEYLREIYFYRTILQTAKAREAYLAKRMEAIQSQLRQRLGREPSLKPFKGSIPPGFDPASPDHDPGFDDLNGDAYFKYRLDSQVRWHTGKINNYKREGTVLTALLILAAASGAWLASVGGSLGIWVALTASIAAAVAGWQQFRSLDWIVKNYSKVVLELTSLHDHWLNLEAEERTAAEFYQMVRNCERVLEAQTMEWNKSMHKALQESGLDQEASLVHQVIRESIESAKRSKEMMRETVVDAAQELANEAEEKVLDIFKAAIGSLAEEAASEIVQQELDAMRKAAEALAKEAVPEPTAAEQVSFTAYHPKEGNVGTWYPLLVYIHTPSALSTVRQDVLRYSDQLRVPKETTNTSTSQLSRGMEITIVPSCEAITFNPERITLKWMEDYQRAEFRFSAADALLDDAAKGRIDFFVGPLIVGSLKFAMLFQDGEAQPDLDREENGEMYRKDAIFVSYSHKDTKIVEAFKLVHEATGYDVLIDIQNLRSGEQWNPALMRMIDQADIFQLFWSPNSSQSEYCEQEWQHALKRNKEGFIRPVYWQLPLPEPPEELSKFHFQFVEL